MARVEGLPLLKLVSKDSALALGKGSIMPSNLRCRGKNFWKARIHWPKVSSKVLVTLILLAWGGTFPSQSCPDSTRASWVKRARTSRTSSTRFGFPGPTGALTLYKGKYLAAIAGARDYSRK